MHGAGRDLRRARPGDRPVESPVDLHGARVTLEATHPAAHALGQVLGRHQVAVQPGRYDVGQLSFGNDMISSVKVPPGWKVTLYQHAGFQGATKVLTADTHTLPDFNDQTSSIVVERM